jgi:hypothetical protein
MNNTSLNFRNLALGSRRHAAAHQLSGGLGMGLDYRRLGYRGASNLSLDAMSASPLTGHDGSPTHEVEGNNREHGADDPHGTKTVAAPATVSGLSSILVAHSAMPLCEEHGKADGRQITVSQETCRHLSIHRDGRGSPEQEYAMKTTSASRRRPTLPFPQSVDCSIVRTA